MIVEIFPVKQHLKCADEITKENLDNSTNAAIIKSASTPASLQAVVRFQNGSNMSLQHKVSVNGESQERKERESEKSVQNECKQAHIYFAHAVTASKWN